MGISSLHLITGRAGSGRTTLLCARLVEHMRAGERAILLVPEQSTFEAEQRLAEAAGGSGTLGVQVLSMERLSERILEKGGDKRTFLNAQGVQMTIRRVAHLHKNELKCFSRTAESRGFAAEIAALIASFKQADISAEQLTAATDAVEGREMLSEKLHDLALLYRETDAALAGRYLTVDDALSAAKALLPQSLAAGVPVYVDGLSAATGQVLSFLDALMGVASEMTVALCYDPDAADDEVFAANEQAYTRLQEMAASHGARVYIKHIVDPEHRKAQPELKHLERSLFDPAGAAYTGEDSGAVTIYETIDRMAEVRALCNTALTLARGGMQYRDMAVVVSDMASYEAPLSRVYESYGVPIFMNQRRPVRGHAAVETLFAAVRASDSGFAQQHILTLAKTGYAGISFEEASVLENYALCFGIRGSMFSSAFKKQDFPDYAVAEGARAKLMEPLMKLHASLGTGTTVHEKTVACYEYLVALGVPGRLSDEAAKLQEAGKAEAAQELTQIWNAVSNLLSEVDTILGDTAMNREEFLSILEEGLSGVSIGVVPDSVDSLQLTPLMRSGGGKVKALLMLGCTDGLLPMERSGDGLLSDEEREYLKTDLALPEMGGTGFYSAHERLTLYEALARPTEKLCLFYPVMGEGGELAPSSLIGRICERLTEKAAPGEKPKKHFTFYSDATPSRQEVTCRADAIRRMTEGMRSAPRDAAGQEELEALKAYFAKTEPELMARLGVADRTGTSEDIGPEMAGLLYGGRLRMSASRLEQFNGCPFRHFISHGLRASARQEYEEKPTDRGTLFHEVLKLFFNYLKEHDIAPESVDETLELQIFDEVFEVALMEHNHGRLREDPRLRIALGAVRDTALNSITMVLGQLKAGNFSPLGMELSFDDKLHEGAFPPIRLMTGDGHEVILHGFIDRVDKARVVNETTGKGTDLYRVIDYKTGGREFDVAAIEDGLTLQLPLYLCAVLQGAKGEGAGMFYMRVSIPAVDEQGDADREQAERVKQGKLNGAVLDTAVGETDHNLGAEKKMDYSKVVARLKCSSNGVSGPLVTDSEMEELIDIAMDRAARTVDEMCAGRAGVSPMDSACDYCDYHSVCCFDPMLPGCKKRAKTPKTTVEKFFHNAEKGAKA